MTNIGGYTLKDTGNCVILSVLIGADQSLVGLKVNNSTVISMKYGDLRKIALSVYGLAENNNFHRSVLGCNPSQLNGCFRHSGHRVNGGRNDRDVFSIFHDATSSPFLPAEPFLSFPVSSFPAGSGFAIV